MYTSLCEKVHIKNFFQVQCNTLNPFMLPMSTSRSLDICVWEGYQPKLHYQQQPFEYCKLKGLPTLRDIKFKGMCWHSLLAVIRAPRAHLGSLFIGFWVDWLQLSLVSTLAVIQVANYWAFSLKCSNNSTISLGLQFTWAVIWVCGLLRLPKMFA